MTSKDNFLRNVILVVDLCKDAIVSLIELDLRNRGKTFEQFVNDNQHEIFHTHSSSKCCQCALGKLPYRKHIIYSSQMERLFEPSRCHQPSNDFCCSKAKKGLCTNVLDLTLAKCLLVNFCTDIFWESCLKLQFNTIDQFLNRNKHELYHLWQNKKTCCLCQPGYTFPSLLFDKGDFETMFRYVEIKPPCPNQIKGDYDICSAKVISKNELADLTPKVKRIVLLYFSKLRKDVEEIVQIRNNNYGHANECLMSHDEYVKSKDNIERLIMAIAKVCNTEREVDKKIQAVTTGPLDQSLYMKYNSLIELYTRQQYIHQLPKENFNYFRMGMIVLNILTDVLYDRLMLDGVHLSLPREDMDISRLYDQHRRHNIHTPSDGRWGLKWQQISQCSIAIGDDIERIRLIRNELLHSATYSLGEMRFNQLYDALYKLLSRFDIHNTPVMPYLDRLKMILVNGVSGEQAKMIDFIE